MDRNTCVVSVCVVFCVFLRVLIQVGVFFCTYLVFLMDEVAQKQTLHFCSNCFLIYQSVWNKFVFSK